MAGLSWDALGRAIAAGTAVCAICGAKQDLNRDHIVPRRAGGRTNAANLQALCRTCHDAKDNPGRRGRKRKRKMSETYQPGWRWSELLGCYVPGV